MYKIYSLTENKEIRYIGYTHKQIEERLVEHINDSKYGKGNSYKRNWIKKCIREKLNLEINLIEEVSSAEEAKKIEILLINNYRKYYRLVNLTNGGDGIQGYKHTKETKDLLSKLSKGKIVNHTYETKKKISETIKRKLKSNEIIHPRKGIKMLEETKNKISEGNKGKIKENKGISHTETYGEKKANSIKNNMRNNHRLSVKILQYDINDNLIKEWSSMYYASQNLGISVYFIKLCISGKINNIENFKFKKA